MGLPSSDILDLISPKPGELVDEVLYCQNSTVIKQLINRGSDVDEKDVNGNTALILASRKGLENIARVLIGHGANIDLKNNQEETALITAARAGHTKIVKMLLDVRASIDEKDCSRDTALIAAVAGGHTDIVRLLVHYGADLEAKNDLGITAFDLAASYQHADILDILNEKLEPQRRIAREQQRKEKDAAIQQAAYDAVHLRKGIPARPRLIVQSPKTHRP